MIYWVMETGELKSNENEKLFLERVATAARMLVEYTGLEPGQRMVLVTGKGTDPETARILQIAGEQILQQKVERCEVTLELTREQVNKKVFVDKTKRTLIVNMDLTEGTMTNGLYDTDLLKEERGRQLAVLDSPARIFDKGGMFGERAEVIETRLRKMESVLQDAFGMRISTLYGTDLKIKLKPGERRWAWVMGKVVEDGVWDNMGAEIFTTPDEFEVEGTLMLPKLDSEFSDRQGVDDWVKLDIVSGMIVNISGGKSAEILKNKMAEKSMAKWRMLKREFRRVKNTEHNVDRKMKKYDPRIPYRIAEVGIGASRGIPAVTDETKSWDAVSGTPTAFGEKGFLHIAFGHSNHDEVGTDGVYDDAGQTEESHWDFAIPGSGGLKVTKFVTERDFEANKNGKVLINGPSMTGLLGL